MNDLQPGQATLPISRIHPLVRVWAKAKVGKRARMSGIMASMLSQVKIDRQLQVSTSGKKRSEFPFVPKGFVPLRLI